MEICRLDEPVGCVGALVNFVVVGPSEFPPMASGACRANSAYRPWAWTKARHDIALVNSLSFSPCFRRAR
jgi:hypothetical protein